MGWLVCFSVGIDASRVDNVMLVWLCSWPAWLAPSKHMVPSFLFKILFRSAIFLMMCDKKQNLYQSNPERSSSLQRYNALYYSDPYTNLEVGILCKGGVVFHWWYFTNVQWYLNLECQFSQQLMLLLLVCGCRHHWESVDAEKDLPHKMV